MCNNFVQILKLILLKTENKAKPGFQAKILPTKKGPPNGNPLI